MSEGHGDLAFLNTPGITAADGGGKLAKPPWSLLSQKLNCGHFPTVDSIYAFLRKGFNTNCFAKLRISESK